MDEVAARLLAALRSAHPVRVRVYDAQEQPREIAVPTRRKRWSQVVETVEAIPWVRVEMLDKAGGILGYVKNDGPADEVEELTAPAGAAASQARWMLELMIRAQTTALQYRDKEHTTLLASVREVLDVQSQAMREMIGLMRAQRDEAMELAQIRAAAAQGDGMDEIVKLIEASPKLMQTLAPVLGLLFRPKQLAAAPQAPPPAPQTPPPAPRPPRTPPPAPAPRRPRGRA